MRPMPHADVPAALPADQGAARAEPRRGRMAPGRGDPERDRARRALRRRRRAPCARRSTRWPPKTSSCAGRARARSSRRTPRRTSSLLPLPAHPPQRRRRRVSRQPPHRRAPRQGVGAEAARAARPQARRRRVCSCAACSSTRGEPVVLDEITLPAALFRGLTKATARRLPGLDVQLLRDRSSACGC